VSSDPGRAAACWQKAEAHLREARAQDIEASPMAVVHSSYYAMFHAARAVLFQVTGNAPKAHDRTIQRFGLLVRDLDEALRAAGRAFNAVKDERNAADYDEATVLSAEEARDALRAAIDFLGTCDARYGFRSRPPAP
jgi:uncharacterized protein (UPF0332 family)